MAIGGGIIGGGLKNALTFAKSDGKKTGGGGNAF